MDGLTFVREIFAFISQLCTGPVCNLFQLEENLEVNAQTLRTSWDELYDISIDFRELLEAHDAKGRKPTHRETGWLQRIEKLETEVETILTESNTEIQERSVGGFFPKNCCYCTSYKLGKRVERKIKEVNELKGKIEETLKMLEESPQPPLLQLPPDPVLKMSIEPITGMGSTLEEAWSCIRDKKVEIMGIHGMGGVGKTTLMKRINNKFYEELASRPGRLDFDVVIWVGVTKGVRMIQKVVARRLGLPLPSRQSLDDRASTLRTALSKKKFVLFFDDVWEPVDLGAIGIPQPHSNSVVIFTTRLESVCKGMGAQNSKITVDCLDWPAAWELFQDKVGEETLSSEPEIQETAVKVAEMCGGLPQALIAMGSAMCFRRTLVEWKHVLENFEAESLGIKEKVYPNLKPSYERLDTDIIRVCFLYCSLFPEDGIGIDQLIRYWIGEELLNASSDMKNIQFDGYDIVGRLKQACLLKGSPKKVMMHNVLRGFALWMGCECGSRNNKFLLVKADIPAPVRRSWEEAERISLVNSSIQSLGDHVPTCRNLFTLIIAGNTCLTNICHHFFRYMSVLKVLDLSGSQFDEFPKSIVDVTGLRYLSLARTNIKKLPQQMKRLSKLKCLDLSSTRDLSFIPSKTLSTLSGLKVLVLAQSNFVYWKTERDQDDENGGARIEELECLHLKYLSITIRQGASLNRLRRACSDKLNRCAVHAFDSDGGQHFEIICGQARP